MDVQVVIDTQAGTGGLAGLHNRAIIPRLSRPAVRLRSTAATAPTMATATVTGLAPARATPPASNRTLTWCRAIGYQ